MWQRPIIQTFCVWCTPFCVLVAAAVGAPQDPAAAPLPRPEGRVHLMLEEELVARQHGVHRIAASAEKVAPHPIVQAELPCEGEGVTFSCVRVVDGEFRMWYQSVHKNTRGRIDIFTHYATSPDGMNWEKRSLGLFEFAGNRQNNLILSGEPTFLEIPSVIVDWARPAAERFTMFGNTPGGGNKLSAFHSADGVHWQPFAGNPLERTVHTSDQIYVAWDPWQQRYLCFCKEDFRIRDPLHLQRLVAPWGRVQRFMVCSNPRALKPWQAIGPGELGEQFGRADAEWPLHQYYGVVPVCYEGNYLGMLAVYHSVPEDDGIDCEWVYSRDGNSWCKTSHRTRIVLRGAADDWDAKNAFAFSLVPVGDDVFIYYGGSSVRHGPPDADAPRPPDYHRRSIGLAKLRRGRLAAIEPVERQGWLETAPVTCSGPVLYANVNPRGGSCRVELRNEAGDVIEGFTADRCQPIDTDGTKIAVRWRGQSDLQRLRNSQVRVRFLLDRAQVFAFQFGEQSAAD